MENAIWSIVIALVAAFSKSVFDRILKEYNPDKKKLISYTKKILLFILRYILPVSILVYSFIVFEFSKIFVLNVSLFMAVIVVNIFMDISDYFSNKVITNIVFFNSKIGGLLNDFVTHYNTENEKSLNNFDKFLDVQEKIIDIQSKILKDMKKK